ncbi:MULTISPECIES: MlaD family protein [unclassified Mycobacterium]|uniref:MlaD family protein n=1 Tax=unclassified Mycobacterium TaxID=2642494 RepID=UPI0029C6FB27|nr:MULTISPECIES: MlaD family protein [unclassified Mycobacterium]
MKITSLTSFIAFVAMIVAFIGYVASLGIRITPPANRVNVSMDVSDVNNIVVDSNVLLHGIPVGKVTDIDTSVSTASIRFYIDGQYKIPVDSDVRLENLSALGESYIELDPRNIGGQVLQNGQRIATEDVKRPASISELGTTVVRVLNQLDPDQLKRTIDEVDVGLPDPNTVLPNISRASLLLRNTTTDLKGRGHDTLDNLQILLENAGFVGPALAQAAPPIARLGPSIEALWNYSTDITLRTDSPASVYHFGGFIQRIQNLLDDRGADIRVLTEPMLGNIKAIAASLTTIDSSQILTHLLNSVPEDGAIDLHVTIPESEPNK